MFSENFLYFFFLKYPIEQKLELLELYLLRAEAALRDTRVPYVICLDSFWTILSFRNIFILHVRILHEEYHVNIQPTIYTFVCQVRQVVYYNSHRKSAHVKAFGTCLGWWIILRRVSESFYIWIFFIFCYKIYKKEKEVWGKAQEKKILWK